MVTVKTFKGNPCAGTKVTRFDVDECASARLKRSFLLSGLRVLLLLLLAGIFANVVEASEFVVAERGKPAKCNIVIPDDAQPSSVYAAEELQRYTEKMTGVKLSVVSQKNRTVSKSICILPSKKYGADGFRLYVDKNGCLHVAGGRRGVLYGVYELLEKYGGCGWYASWHEVVPQKNRFSVPLNLDDVQKPAFEMRSTVWKDVKFNPDFGARLRFNGHPCDGLYNLEMKHGGMPLRFVEPLRNCHTFRRILDDRKYFDSHPEWFSEIRGIRRKGVTQICLTNPGAFEQAYSNICELIDRDAEASGKNVGLRLGDVAAIGISQNDWANYCECPACKAVDDHEESHAGSMLHFVNRMADRLSKRYPGMMTLTSMYQYSRKAVKTMRPGDNVIPCLSSIECSFAHPLAKRSVKANDAFMDDLEAWGKLSKNLYLWNYTMGCNFFFHPLPNVRVIGPNIRTFHENGTRYLFEEGGPQYADFAQLKAWLISKFAWNPYQPLEPLLDRFFKGHYGAAAPFVREYLEMSENAVADKPSVRFTIWERVRKDVYSYEFIARARELFKKAEQAVKDDPVRLWNVRLQAFVPVCMYLNWRSDETKWIWATRTPEKFRDCSDVQDDISYAEAFEKEIVRRGGKLHLAITAERNSQIWHNWRKMRGFKRPDKGCDVATVGVDELNFTHKNFGERVKDPEAYGGECFRAFNTEDWRGPVMFPFCNVAYDADAEYIVRFRAKVEKAPGGKGEAFNAELDRQRIAPKVEEVADGWQWYEFKPVKLKDWLWFEYKSGRFAKGGGRNAVKCSYIDRIEIRRCSK